MEKSATFWCYDPTKNIWAKKADIDKSFHKPMLFKAKRNVCIFSASAEFQVYDFARDCWDSVINNNIVLKVFQYEDIL